MMWIGLILLLVIAYGIYQMPEKKRLAEEQAEILKQQEFEEAKARKERYEKERTDQLLTSQDMKSLSDSQLSSLLAECSSEIMKFANSVNKSPFGIALIEEYSPDKYILMASSSSTQTEEQRITYFRSSNYMPSFINTSYGVLFTHDGFSGPIKEVKNFFCEYKPGPVFSRVRQSYN